jgi:hypothetical protein
VKVAATDLQALIHVRVIDSACCRPAVKLPSAMAQDVIRVEANLPDAVMVRSYRHDRGPKATF